MERISTNQWLMLGSGVTLGVIFIRIGSDMAQIAGRDGWLVVLPGSLAVIPFGLMLFSLAQKYPKKNLIQISKELLGKWVSKGFGILYILISSLYVGLLVGRNTDMFVGTILPEIPHRVYIISFSILVFMLVNAGIEVLARFSEIVVPIVALGIIVTALLSIPRFEPGELYPFFENGVLPLFYAFIKAISWSIELIFFLTGLLSFLPQSKLEMKLLKTHLWLILLLTGILQTMSALIAIWVFGPTEAARLTYGILALGSMIEITRAFSGVESIFSIIWLGVQLIKTVAFYFIAFWGIQSVFRIKGWIAHLLIIPFLIGIPFMIKQGSDIVVGTSLVSMYLILPFTVTWVMLVWGVNWWKQRKSKRLSMRS